MDSPPHNCCERHQVRQDGSTLERNHCLKNTNGSCNALANAIVDIWHCDKGGNYSEYGGSGMQSTNYTSVHLLRGRQVTTTSGEAAFTSIFPGWYNGTSTYTTYL
ncbi:hypothetical protein R1T16_07960 [Flavobacterium sp. DG1-102-2]|uniref:dioxygenase family protein n=1 Tax=Flavobacterium sp. DG1-102-2 TaxID=3081663 RepID=UPI002949CBC8|nr:hypothetical protein [Flavobacterium sp. DG1-102-2]MDV6168358.1 hypothetical protein [Flavobacterium sp. DG1-102-2]